MKKIKWFTTFLSIVLIVFITSCRNSANELSSENQRSSSSPSKSFTKNEVQQLLNYESEYNLEYDISQYKSDIDNTSVADIAKAKKDIANIYKVIRRNYANYDINSISRFKSNTIDVQDLENFVTGIIYSDDD